MRGKERGREGDVLTSVLALLFFVLALTWDN